ncbi:Hypothetical protein NTJ_06506 [Nesidiocoris tenuis]|uniref:Uncharacterized protein n=1 Tax=Nesidiocoris tenuis TaxID=355587 RepID=A0ABN7ATG2_9HEMI|nr:Hypothetical protein NTJ_06506 [Nesidiocoris tenuis]
MCSAVQRRFAYPLAIPATPSPVQIAQFRNQEQYRATLNQYRAEAAEVAEVAPLVAEHAVNLAPSEIHEHVASPVVHRFVQPIHVDKIVQPVVHHYYKRPIVHHTIESPSLDTSHTFTDYNTHHVHYLLKR